MKALMPDAGCRAIADTFNRRHARHRETGRRMTVGKSFVADTIRRHRYEIEILRRRIRHRVPPALPRNLAWTLLGHLFVAPAQISLTSPSGV